MPAPTHAAPMTAPTSVPTLHMPWNRAMIGARAARSTVAAWVFIATSSAPWNVPHNASAPNRAAPDLASPTVVPATA